MGVRLEDFLGVTTQDSAWPSQITHLSQSSIGMLLRCPRQFERRYLHGEKERPGEAIVIGSFFHEATEHNYLQKIQSHEDLPISEIITYLNDAAIPKVLDEEGGESNIRWDSGLDTARKDTERITTAYAHAVMPRIQPIGVEHKFEIDMEGVPVPIIGYIDLWEEGRNIDAKTGSQSVKKVKPSWSLQGRLYSWASGRPTEYHSISRAKTPKITTALESDGLLIPVPSEAQRENMAHIFRTAVATIAYYYSTLGDTGWPTFGAVPDWTRNMLPCDYCGWRAGCPAWS